MNTQTFPSTLLALSLTVALGTMAMSTGARAEQDPSGLSAFDKNKDGMISKEEYMSTGGTDKTFAMYDLNGDGKLDKTEFGKAKGGETGTPKGGEPGGAPMPTR